MSICKARTNEQISLMNGAEVMRCFREVPVSIDDRLADAKAATRENYEENGGCYRTAIYSCI